MKRLLLAASFLAGSLLPAAAIADSPQHLVDSATLALQDIMQSSAGNTVGVYLRQARAIVVCPNIFRGGLFIVGGEGGGCLMLARTSDGNWSNPAFYSLGSASFGPQIGVQSAEVMMLVMTSGGLNALLNSQFKFGADAGLTVATLGAGVNGSMSTALDADIITFSKTQGLYGGVSLQGSILSNDSGTEQQYYGTALDARQIVLNLDGSNPGANPLRETLTHFGR
jgi:lipid-binding SYLF domain-containing protein